MSELLIIILVLIVLARATGELMQRFGQLALLGELLIGILMGAIIIHGNVEKGCQVYSEDSVHIDGKILGSIVESYGQPTGRSDGKETHVIERGVFVQGEVKDSTIKGQDVHLGKVKDSIIHALRKAVVEEVSSL